MNKNLIVKHRCLCCGENEDYQNYHDGGIDIRL